MEFHHGPNAHDYLSSRKTNQSFELLHRKTSERPEQSNQEVTIDAAQRRGKPRCFNCQEEGHVGN